jgi:membrane-bound metal-dependent hydrolase YbcI (DUF457 family)
MEGLYHFLPKGAISDHLQDSVDGALMTAPTHITFAEFIYLLILTTTGVALSFTNALVVGFAAVLADIDTGASRIGRVFPALTIWIERRFGHRTLTHSMVFAILLAVILLPLLLFVPDIYVVFLAGYLSHPILDTVTINGVKLFWPFSNSRCVFPLEVNHPYRYRTQTGSKVDRALGLIFLLGCVPTYLIAAQGYERFIRFTQKNIESAVRDYNELSRTHQVFADIRAHNLLTKERIEGRFEVIGAINTKTLIFRGPEHRLHSLGVEYQSEYVAERVLCQEGSPVRISCRQIDMENQPLIQLREQIEPGREAQFFGELKTPDPFAVPQDGNEFLSISGSGGSIKFSYASYDDIRKMGLENLFINKGTLTMRTLIPETEVGDSNRAGAAQFARYSRVSFQIDIKEPLELLIARGDTVTQGQLIATWGALLDTRNKMDLLRKKVDATADEIRMKLSEADEKILQARNALEADSISQVIAGELARQGYASNLALDQSLRKRESSRLHYDRLRAERGTLRQRYEIILEGLYNEIEGLSQKARRTALASESHAPVAGIIEEVRQAVLGTKVHVYILIRQQ